MLTDIVRHSGIGKTVQVQFGGFDRRPGAGDGSFWETTGMTADRFPLMASREQRTPRSMDGVSPGSILGMGDVLLVYAEHGIYYNGWLLCSTPAGVSPRMVAFGQKVIIENNRKILDLRYPLLGLVATAEELPQNVDPGNAYAVGDPTSLSMSPEIYVAVRGSPGWEAVGPVIQSLEATALATGYNAEFPSAGSYQGEAAEWNTLRLWSSGTDLRKKFKPGDAVTISGCVAQPKNNQTLIVREVQRNELRFYENSFEPAWIWQHEIVSGPGGVEFEPGGVYEAVAEGLPDYDGKRCFTMDADTMSGMSVDPEVPDLLAYWLPKAYNNQLSSANPVFVFYKWDAQNEVYVSYSTITARVKAAREDPDPIDFTKTDHVPGAGSPASEGINSYYEPHAVTVSREWPEKLTGIFADSNRLWGWEGHTLRASKLGDPGNWNFFDGTAEDSWAVDVHTPENFTGGISVNGYPTFYTAHRRYRIYGSEPESFQLSELDCQGVKAGCAGSMVILFDTLYYVSAIGIMRDDGTEPVCVSEALGEIRLTEAAGGGAGRKYWVSGADQNGSKHLLVLDVENGVWIRDGSQRFLTFTRAGEIVVGLELGGTAQRPIKTLWDFRASENGEGTLLFDLQTNNYTMSQPNRKRVHRIQLRMRIGSTPSLTVSIRYDDGDSWVQVAQLSGEGKTKSVYLPVLPRRCDRFALRFQGSGDWELQSLALETRAGSAVF